VFVTRVIPEAGLERIRQACEVRVWEDELPPPRDVLRREVAGVEGVLSLLSDQIDA